MPQVDPQLTAPVLKAASHYKLAIPRTPIGGRVGEVMGTGVGSSLEFQDFREYVPGDDLRHVDWNAYARSDTLTIRLYREEVRPMVDIIVDVSRSMTTGDGAKVERTRQLAALLLHLAHRADADPLLWCGDAARRFASVEEFHLPPADFADAAPLTHAVEQTASRFRLRSLRYVISDFLFEHDPDNLVRLLAQGASALALIQILTPEEADPKLEGGHRLVDVESAYEINLMIGREEIDAYLARLKCLRNALSRAGRRARGAFIAGTADQSVDAWCKEHLCPAGVIEAG